MPHKHLHTVIVDSKGGERDASLDSSKQLVQWVRRDRQISVLQPNLHSEFQANQCYNRETLSQKIIYSKFKILCIRIVNFKLYIYIHHIYISRILKGGSQPGRDMTERMKHSRPVVLALAHTGPGVKPQT